MTNLILNHRCTGSVKSRASIRYETRSWFPDESPKWIQYHHDYDSEYGTERQAHVGEIKFCPYCGIELVKLSGGN